MDILRELDLGERCVFCGRSTAWGAGEAPFVNRIPAGTTADQSRFLPLDEQLETTSVLGFKCLDCQADDCDACVAEGAGQAVDAADFVSMSGALCDDHLGLISCSACGEQVDEPPFTQNPDGTLAHEVCPDTGEDQGTED